jgi:hypothetical protein
MRFASASNKSSCWATRPEHLAVGAQGESTPDSDGALSTLANGGVVFSLFAGVPHGVELLPRARLGAGQRFPRYQVGWASLRCLLVSKYWCSAAECDFRRSGASTK